MLPEAVAQGAAQVGLAAQGVGELAFGLDEEGLVVGGGQVGVAREQVDQGGAAAFGEPLGGDAGAGEAHVVAGGAGGAGGVVRGVVARRVR